MAAISTACPHSPAGAQVLRGGEHFTQVAIEDGAVLAIRLPQARAEPSHPAQPDQGQHGEEAEGRAQPHVQHGNRHQHADQQEHTAQHLHHEAGEESGQCVHIAVDALDQLARCARRMEAWVEAQQVGGQISA